jgi:hypothetical protein
MMMKGGKYQSRSHALMNNPIIRNYLKGNIITSNAFPSTSSSTASKTITTTTIPTIPTEEERITTQPIVVIGKRKREDEDHDQTTKVDRKGKGKESIEVAYTLDNLPPVLTKCKPFFHSIPFRLKF